MNFLITENSVETYETLLFKINQGVCDNFFTSFVADLVSNKHIDLSSYEMNKTKNDIKDISDLRQAILNTKSTVKFETSGTTGRPKRITHEVSFLLGKTKQNSNPSVWLYTYNKYHMGGIQVLLQVLVNKSTIVDAYKKNREYILDAITTHKVTKISATPTFYKLLMPIEKSFSTVQRVTVGGERTDSKTIDILTEMFPDAKINNIYATTEHGAILFSKSNIFSLNERVMIKEDLLLVKTGDNIHYNTGDLVKMINETEFVFVGRNTEIINIGGRNINPNHVEDVITSHPKISQATVYAKSNKLLGNVLACKVVSTEISMKEIKQHLKEQIQEEYKIPRIITMVDSLSVSKNNKVMR